MPSHYIASSKRSSPQAISHSVPSVPKLFPTVSRPSTLSSLPCRSFPSELSPSYFHGLNAVSFPASEALPKLFARFPVRPPCCLAPSQRICPQAISTVSSPSSMLSRSLPANLSASYLHGFLSAQHAVSLPPSEALPKLFPRFPVRPACCIAPSQRSSPQAICTVSYPSSMLSRSLPAKLSPSYFHGFQSVQHAVSLPPSEAPRKLFARFPIPPACCLASSQRSSPQAICTVSSPSSMLYRSLPAKLSASYLHGFLSYSMLSRSLPAKLSTSYFHGFLSVQHAVSLPPSEALRKLFARFPLRPACCLAPSQRSSPQAISTVSSPSSMLSRSLPAKLSASYLHGFLSVQHAVSLPPSEALRKLFARFPSSMLSRSLPAKLSASYLHGFLIVQHAVSLPPGEALHKLFARFPSVQHAVSLPPGEAFRKLFPRFPFRPACCLAPSQRSSPQAICTVSSPSNCCLAPSQRSFLQAICTVSSPSSMLSRSLPAKLSASYLHGFLSVQHAVSLPPSEAFRKLFARFPIRPACCLAPPSEALPKLFARFPVRPACCLAPSQRSFPQAICTVSSPSSMLSRSLPAELSPSYFHGSLSVQHAVSLPPSEAVRKLFPRFPLRPACCLAPSQRSSPQAICTVSYPSSVLSRSLVAKLSASYFHGFLPSSMLSRSLPANLSASYFHGFLSVQHAVSLPPSEALRKLFARFPLRPACCLAPSQRSSPYKLFPPFPVRPACCLAPSQRSFPKAICTVSYPSSMLSRSLPAKLPPSYFHGFLSVQHAVSLPPSEAFRKLFARFPIRPTCCVAPSQRSFPQAISMVSSPSSMLSRSLPAKLSASYLHGFQSVQHTVSLPPSEALPKLFARFPVRPACCLAPSQRSFPQAICTVSSPSSMLSRSLPAKLSPSYFHGFQSVQHAVSLPPSEAFRKLFARFPLRPACCLAPSQRSSPQAICTVSCPSSMLSRSLPAKLSPSYLHGFLSVQHAVSLPPNKALRKLFPRFPLCPACCLAPSRRSSPQAISTVSYPSSMLSRSLPAKLSASYLHSFLSVQHAVSLLPSEALRKLIPRFPLRPACCLAPSQRSFPQAICTVLSVQHAVSLPPSEALPKLFARFPVRPACCLAPSQRSFPQAICTVSSPSSMLSRSFPAKLTPSYLHGFQSVQLLSRSLPAKLSASYLHGFLSVQHAVSLPPSEALPKLFARFPVRPACCLAPSQRSSPQAICTVSCPSSMLSRSLPTKLSASYFHGFLSVQHAVSLPPGEALRKLFPRFPLRPACCLAPSQRSSPQAICTVSSPSSMLSRSLPAKLSVS